MESNHTKVSFVYSVFELREVGMPYTTFDITNFIIPFAVVIHQIYIHNTI